MSVLCPECESVVVVDVEKVEEGDTVVCEECGRELEVVALEPLKVRLVDASGDDDPDERSYAEDEE